MSITEWIKAEARAPCSVSYIWNGLMKIKHWLIGNLRWEIESSTLLEIGLEYPVRGFNGDHTLPITLIQHIHNTGIYYLNHLQVEYDPIFQYPSWVCSQDLGLFGEMVVCWYMYIQNLSMEGMIILRDKEDIFTWDSKIE